MMNTSSKRRAVVHIGLEKTGTTSIQDTLCKNRRRLREAGFLFPQSPGKINHTRLVAACLEFGVLDNIKADLLAYERQSEAELLSKFEQAFDAELNAAGAWQTLIVSSELISSRLHARSEVERLMGLLDPHVDEICILVFLRRQDRLALSRFSSALRAGHAGFDSVFNDLSANSFLQLPRERNEDDNIEFFNHERTLSRFENLGDKVSLKVELYDPPEGTCDPVRLFYDHLGPSVPTPDPEQKTKRLNSAMSAEAQYVISQLNGNYSVQLPSGERNEAYRSLQRQVEMEVSGRRRTVMRSDAETFFEHFRDSNEQVRARYFPTQKTLFDVDFSSYPHDVDYEEMKQDLVPLIQRYFEIASKCSHQKNLWIQLKRSLRCALVRRGLIVGR